MITEISAAVAVPLLFAVLFPVGLLFLYKKTTNASVWCFIAGAICFVLFATVLESLLHSVMITGTNRISKKILSSPLLYAAYGALAAGLFEETGRLFGFKVLLRKYPERSGAAAYGIGHGGIEVLLTLGVSYAMLAAAQAGMSVVPESSEAQLLSAANSVTFATSGLAIIERISAMMLHIGLSMIMFIACRRKGKLWLWPAAIVLHSLADVPVALYQIQAIHSLYAVEAFIFLAGVLCLIVGKRLMSGYSGPEHDIGPESGENAG